MTIPSKKSRKITVNSTAYRYIVTGNDGWVDLIIELQGIKGVKYVASFDYFHNESSVELLKEYGYKIGDDLIITPKIVKKVIEFALNNACNPLENENQEKKSFRSFWWK